jgi:hypothetical protein
MYLGAALAALSITVPLFGKQARAATEAAAAC